MTSRPRGLLHGEVGDVGRGGDLELEHALRGGGAPVEHRAVHRGEGVARDHRGLDGQLLDVGLGLLGGGGGGGHPKTSAGPRTARLAQCLRATAVRN